MKVVGRALKACPCALVVDDEEIAVRPVDVTQSHVNERKSRRGVELQQRGRQQLAREVVVHPAGKQTGGKVSFAQAPDVVTLRQI